MPQLILSIDKPFPWGGRVGENKKITKNLSLYAGLFIVLPCIESYKKVDLRTITLGVPPQEVGDYLPLSPYFYIGVLAADQGLRDRVRGCGGVLQGIQCHCQCDQRERYSSQHKVWYIQLPATHIHSLRTPLSPLLWGVDGNWPGLLCVRHPRWRCNA